MLLAPLKYVPAKFEVDADNFFESSKTSSHDHLMSIFSDESVKSSTPCYPTRSTTFASFPKYVRKFTEMPTSKAIALPAEIKVVPALATLDFEFIPAAEIEMDLSESRNEVVTDVLPEITEVEMEVSNEVSDDEVSEDEVSDEDSDEEEVDVVIGNIEWTTVENRPKPVPKPIPEYVAKKCTQFCKTFNTQNECPHGAKCCFAHAVHELNVIPCKHGERCFSVVCRQGMYHNGKMLCPHSHPMETADEVRSRVRQFITRSEMQTKSTQPQQYTIKPSNPPPMKPTPPSNPPPMKPTPPPMKPTLPPMKPTLPSNPPPMMKPTPPPAINFDELLIINASKQQVSKALERALKLGHKNIKINLISK